MTIDTEPRLHILQAELADVSRDTALGSFATSIAHELNQPLTAIANYIETFKVLIDAPRPESLATIRGALDECAEQSIRAGQIVRRLRDAVSRTEAEHSAEPLAAIVIEAAQLALAAAGPGIALESDFDPSAPHVLVDRVQIQQCIVNLVRNAAEALEGRVDGVIRITSRALPTGEVELCVEDNGPGLPSAVVARLFQPFVPDGDGGLGIGLSVCQTVIEANGGRIWADTSSLGGAAFRLTMVAAGGGGRG